MKQLLSSNEAIARGTYEAGIRICSAYPGAPSTEILENVTQYKADVYCEWAPNEKVAGSRSLCAMKHVGLNVAADPLFTAGYMGTNAGYINRYRGRSQHTLLPERAGQPPLCTGGQSGDGGALRQPGVQGFCEGGL